MLSRGDPSIYLILLYSVFSIQVVMAFLACGITYKILDSKRKPSTLLTYALKIFSLYAILINTILTLPFFDILLNTLYCTPSDLVHQNMSCYTGIYYLHLACGVVAFAIMLVFALLFNYLYTDLNPFSSIPYASPQSLLTSFKLALKAILPFYVAYDSGVN